MEKSNRYGFLNSEAPLTSKRGRLVLSNPVQAEILIKAVRESRSGKDAQTSPGKIDFSPDVALKISQM